jgi:transglutaminase-like putative cysteine protease
MGEMKLSVFHSTRYHYSAPLRHTVQMLHLWPTSGPWQTVDYWAIKAPAPVHGRLDGFGNRVHQFSLAVPASATPLLSAEIEANGIVHTNGASLVADLPHMPHPAMYLRSTPLSEAHPRLAAWARQVLGAAAARPATPDSALALAVAVGDQVRYRKGSTDVETTALEAFDWGLGVCQDQAHVLVAVCRSLGWPARYVSGYFYAADEPDLASHAWADVCVDVAARHWLSLDVTHACPTDERHLRLASGTDYSTCPPIKGLRQGGGQEKLEVRISLTAL